MNDDAELLEKMAIYLRKEREMGILYRDERDTTDPIGPKFRRGTEWVERAYDDRWPARGLANQPTREYCPLEDVSREGRPEEYRKRPSGR